MTVRNRALRLAAAAGVLSLLSLAGCPAQQGGDLAGGAAPETEDDKTFYTLGFFVMSRTTDFDLDEHEQAMVLAGAADALAGKEPVADPQTYQPKLQALFHERQTRGAEAEKLASQQWLDEQAEEAGAVKTASGLVFIEVEPGSERHPVATDTVRVHYHGTLRDGTVFDSSVDRGTPAVFPLNRVIPCWTEALQRVGVGGKARVLCPSQIAYGDRGAPPKIAPGAALHFDVELLEIVE